MASRDKATNQIEDYRRRNKVRPFFLWFMKFEFVFQWNSKFQNPGVLTTAHGAPIGDKTNSMSVGPRGTQLSKIWVELSNID